MTRKNTILPGQLAPHAIPASVSGSMALSMYVPTVAFTKLPNALQHCGWDTYGPF